jgi:putative tricarboxylic transport membrane protein
VDSIFQAASDSLSIVFSWPYILYPIAGTVLSMLFAGLPGIGGVTLMALAIPFLFGADPIPTMLLFGSFVGGATFMGSATAILLGIPGKASNAATVLDGHPLAARGMAKTALGCSAAASALGSTFGILVLILLIPVMRDAILLFGPTEFLMLAVWGVTTVAVVTRGSVVKGLGVAGCGLLVTFIGSDPRTGEFRFTVDSIYLRDGLDFVPVFLGIFALAEVISMVASSRSTISGRGRLEELGGSVWEGCLTIPRNLGLFFRSSILGTLIGMIPGIGGTIASFVAYGHAVQSSGPDKERFGTGDIRGVLAPEAANDAKDGGALVPTLAFGVPGGAGTALLLVALTQHNLVPGRELMTNHLDYVFLLIASLFLSNWLTSILGLAFVNPLARLTVAPTHLLTPPILLLASVGAYLYKGRIEDVVAAYAFGFLGYFMKKHDWPRVVFVTALVLGGMLETNFHISLRLIELGRVQFWSRPITVVLTALTVITLVQPLVAAIRRNGRAENR